MNRLVTRMGWFLLGALLVAAAGGCDNNSDVISTDDGGGATGFVIVPSAVQLGFDEKMASFSVQGGDAPMTWSVSDSALGTLTGTDGRFVNYTRTGATEGVNEITVEDVVGRTARAMVVQDDERDVGPLALAPSRATLPAVGDTVTLSARGGVPPYSWRVIDSSLGTLSNTGQSAVNYRRTGEAAGNNVVELVDSLGELATATIFQPALPEPPADE